MDELRQIVEDGIMRLAPEVLGRCTHIELHLLRCDPRAAWLWSEIDIERHRRQRLMGECPP